MPTYRIRAPNGRTYRVQGPEGATEAQVRAEVLRQFPDAGRTPDYDELSPQQARTALERGESRLRERTSGMTEQQREQARRTFEASPAIKALRDRADDFSMETFGRDLGKATVNTAAGLAQGAASVAEIPWDVGTAVHRGVNYGVGKAGGGLLRAVGLEDAGQSFERSAQDIDRQLAGQSAPVSSLIEQVAPTPRDTPGQAARLVSQVAGGAMVPLPFGKSPAPIQAPKAAAPVNAADDIVREGQRAGVRVMTSDVKPPKTFIGKMVQAVGERIPFAGTSGPRAAQQSQRVEAVRSLLRDFGGDDVVQLIDDAPSALDDVAKSLTARRGRELTRLTGAKRGIISKYSGAGEVPVTNTLRAIDDQIAELTRRGTRPALAVADDLKSLRTAVQGKSLDQLEAIRADELSNAFKGGDTLADVRVVGEKAIRAIYDPLRRDMGEFITSRGGAADAKTWRTANESLAAMAGELDSTTFKNVLKNSDLTPEAVGRLLFSKNRSDVARLFSNLDEPGKARAQAAVLQRAFDKSISAESGLSVEKFVNNLSSMSNSVGVAFQGDDLARVQGLAKVLDATRRAATASAAPATGVQNTPIVGGYALGSLFGQGALPVAGAGGLLARAYESAPVRNLLLKLGRAPKGSAAEGRLLTQVERLITATAVSQRQKLAGAANDEVPAALAAQEQEEDGN